MTEFDAVAGPLAGKIKTEPWESAPVTEADLTNISFASPHFIRCAIERNPTREEIDEGKGSRIEVANWLLGPFPTRDAADSHAQEVRDQVRHVRGEPEQAWSDIAKMTRCPNPQLFPKFRNLQMTLVPAQAPKSEPVPHDHPAYAGSFAERAAKRAAAAAKRADRKPRQAAGGSPVSGGDGPAEGGPAGKVRRRAPSPAGGVPKDRGGRKGPKGKAKQGAPKKGKQ